MYVLLDDPEGLEAKDDKSAQKVDLLLVSSPLALNEEVLSMYFEKFSSTAEISKHGDNQWILKLNTQSGENVLCNLCVYYIPKFQRASAMLYLSLPCLCVNNELHEMEWIDLVTPSPLTRSKYADSIICFPLVTVYSKINIQKLNGPPVQTFALDI